jgi:flagellum-specific peptidoglycan hydrolase FlgJ
MKTRILAAIALVVALPAAAQANSVMEQRAFAQQHEALNTQATSEYQLLPSDYRINTVSGGHSTAADQSLAYVAAITQRATDIAGGNGELVGQGQSVAAAQALQNVNGGADAGQGNVEVTFASLD